MRKESYGFQIDREIPSETASLQKSSMKPKSLFPGKEELANRIKDIPYADGTSLTLSLGIDPTSTAPISARMPKISPTGKHGPVSVGNLLPTLQLLYSQGVGGGRNSVGAGEAFLLEAKLRRRYAHEWEFLASVLDRVLLIAFSVLILLVTAAMVAVGEAIHFSYSLIEDHPQDVSGLYGFVRKLFRSVSSTRTYKTCSPGVNINSTFNKSRVLLK
jgi:hypothetical protein